MHFYHQESNIIHLFIIGRRNDSKYRDVASLNIFGY